MGQETYILEEKNVFRTKNIVNNMRFPTTHFTDFY
jgi:hypothetical protein